MRCPSCGEIIVDGNRFCTNCGHPVGEELPLPDEDFGRPYESAAPAKSNNRFLYAVIALLAMLLLVLTYLVFGSQIMEKLHPSAPEALSAPVMTASFSSGSLQSSCRRSSRDVSSFVMSQYFLSEYKSNKIYFTSEAP